MLFITYFLVAFVSLALISTVYFCIVNGISAMPSSEKVLDLLRQHLPAEIKGDIIEAGAGWGGVSFWLAEHYPENRIFAWENAWLPFCLLWIRSKCGQYQNLHVRYGDFIQQPLDSAGLIYTFLCRKGMKKVYHWITKQPSASLLLVSYMFSLPGIKPDKVFKLNNQLTNELLFYIY